MSRIASFCAEYIGKHGPAPVETIYQAAYAAGVTTARTPTTVTQAMRDRPTFVLLPDGSYTCAQRLLVGAAFTHRISGDRATDQYVWPGVELDPLRQLVKELGEVPIEGGGVARANRYGQEAWKVPPGTLADVPRNGLLSVMWTGDCLRVAPAAVDHGESRIHHVRSVLIRHRRRAMGSSQRYGYRRWLAQEDLGRMVLSALTEVPDLLAEPVPPLDELVGLSPAEAVNLLYSSVSEVLAPEHGLKVALEMPEPLYAELEARASLLKVVPEELMIGVLAREMWRTAPQGMVPYEPRYASKRRHLSAVPQWDEDEDNWMTP